MTTQNNAETVESYQEHGYVVIENLIQPDAIEALSDRIREYTHGNRPPGGIVMQTEPRVERGELQVDHPGDGIRKIEKLVQHDDLFRDLALNERLLGFVEQVLGPDLKLFRNALLLKPPSVGSPKGMHQDSPYWPIEPMSLCQCWFALDDATEENGCLAVIPGSHKTGPQPHMHVTDDFVIDEQYYNPAEMVLAPVPAGSGVFFHSLLMHYSAPNRSDKWRRAIALAYMSSQSRYTGNRDGKLGGETPEYFSIKGKSYPGCV